LRFSGLGIVPLGTWFMIWGWELRFRVRGVELTPRHRTCATCIAAPEGRSQGAGFLLLGMVYLVLTFF
jgi:hypothetical protein